MVVAEKETWQERGACRETEDPDAFFARTGDFEGSLPERRQQWDEKMAYAKGFCAQCQVRTECLVAAYESGEVKGIAGGLDERRQRALFKAEHKRRAGLRTTGSAVA